MEKRKLLIVLLGAGAALVAFCGTIYGIVYRRRKAPNLLPTAKTGAVD